MAFSSTLLPDNDEGKKVALDLLDKINSTDENINSTISSNVSAIETELDKQAYKGVFHAQHQVGPGVASGTVSASAWRTGPLNTVLYNDISGASLSSDSFTLPAGLYKVIAFRCCFYVNAYATRIYNTTDDTTAIIGSNGYADQGDGYNSEYVPIHGIIDISKTTTFQVQLYAQTTRSSDGWGFSTNSLGDLNRVWSDVLVERLKYK
jgi:hypothetical protein